LGCGKGARVPALTKIGKSRGHRGNACFHGIFRRAFRTDQRCGRREQYSARKAALAATPVKPVEDGRRNLLCTMQKQDCLFLVQMTISF
jgi:hypothetical protein